MNDLRQLLCDAGNQLSMHARGAILAESRDPAATLIDVMMDEHLQRSEDDAESMAPIHAARLLGELRAEAAIPGLLATLLRMEPGYILWDAALFALEAIGARVLEPALALVPDVAAEQRSYLACVLSRLNVRDPRILTLLLDELRRDPLSGAAYLGQYRDPTALPELQAAFDAFPLDSSGRMFANQALVELHATIEDCGGVLTPAQHAKYLAATSPQRKFREELLGLTTGQPTSSLPAPARAKDRPGRNDPCWCGSGRKYKKCHLGHEPG